MIPTYISSATKRGSKHFCMHALRHTYATRAIERGDAAQGVAEAAGSCQYQDDHGQIRPCHQLSPWIEAVRQFEGKREGVARQSKSILKKWCKNRVHVKHVDSANRCKYEDFLKRGMLTMKLGIVGLPNVGKSTLFNAITNAGAESANYPFCTIEPNVGMVAVPDAAAGQAGGDVPARQKDPRRHRVCGHCGPGEGRQPGARAWATSSWRTSAAPTPSSMWCAASTTRTSCTWWPTPAPTCRWTPWATSRPSTWS